MKKLFLLLVCFSALFAQDFEFVWQKSSSNIPAEITNFNEDYLYALFGNELITFNYEDIRELVDVNILTLNSFFRGDHFSHFNEMLYIAMPARYPNNGNYLYSINTDSPGTPELISTTFYDSTYSNFNFYSFSDSTTNLIYKSGEYSLVLKSLNNPLYNDTLHAVFSDLLVSDIVRFSNDTAMIVMNNSNTIVRILLTETGFSSYIDTIYSCSNITWLETYNQENEIRFVICDFSTDSPGGIRQIRTGYFDSLSIIPLDSTEIDYTSYMPIKVFQFENNTYLRVFRELFNVTEHLYLCPIEGLPECQDISSIIITDSTIIEMYNNHCSTIISHYTPTELIDLIFSQPLTINIYGDIYPFITPDSILILYSNTYCDYTSSFQFNNSAFLKFDSDSNFEFADYLTDSIRIQALQPLDSFLFGIGPDSDIRIMKYEGELEYSYYRTISDKPVKRFEAYKGVDNKYYILMNNFERTTDTSAVYSVYIAILDQTGSIEILDSFPGITDLFSFHQTKDSTTYILMNPSTEPFDMDEYGFHFITKGFSNNHKSIDIDDSTFYSLLYIDHDYYFIPYPNTHGYDTIFFEDLDDPIIFTSNSDKKYIFSRNNKLIALNDNLTIKEIYNIPFDDFGLTGSYRTQIYNDYLFISSNPFFSNDYLYKVYHIPSEILVDYEISEGWNMLSYPFNGKSVSDGLFPFAVGPIYNYDPETGYIPADTITCNDGFWLLSDRDTTVSFSSLATAQFYEDTLKRGFNLIGMPGTPLPASAILDYPHTIGGAYEYVPSLRTYTEPDTLTPTKGYWIFADSLVPYRLGL